HLRRFQVARREAIVPFGDELPWGAHGAVLAPWPNRIDAGTYSWEGEEYRLPLTEPERNNAIHGLVMTEPWQPAQVTPGHAEFTVDLAASAGYPFPLRLSVAYLLNGADLTVDFRAENHGGRAAPCGVGFHPMLAAAPGGRRARVRCCARIVGVPARRRRRQGCGVDARAVWRVAAVLLPLSRGAAGSSGGTDGLPGESVQNRLPPRRSRPRHLVAAAMGA